MLKVIITVLACSCALPCPARSQLRNVAEKAFTLVGVEAHPLQEIHVRAAPDRASRVVRDIPGGTCLRVLEDRGAWLKVRVCRTSHEGFVYRPLVTTSADVVITGYLSENATLRGVRLEPSTPRAAPPGANPHTLRVAEIWNKYGGLLSRLATDLNIETEAAIAVIAAESDGVAFSEGQPVIRFENHIFWDEWGKRNPQIFDRHFRFQRHSNRHLQHQFRASANQPWEAFHDRGQRKEWPVLEFARGLDRRSANRSASWGMPQIMVFNHGEIGYSSVDNMITSFSDPRTGVQMQILGFFDFIRGRLRNSPRVMALRNRDWSSFAQMYNGLGREQAYVKPLSTYYDAARLLLRR